jgi:hypothetical protein
VPPRHDGGIVAGVRRGKGRAVVSVGLLGVATADMPVMAVGVLTILIGWLAAAGVDVRPQG